jgi:hypothetical protein
VQPLTRYLIELRHPAGGWEQLQQIAARVRRAVGERQHQGSEVRFLRSIFVPEDNACFFLIEASSADMARQVIDSCNLGILQINETVKVTGAPMPDRGPR